MALQRVKIEVDARLVSVALKSLLESVSVFNDFIIACKRELSPFPWVTVDFIYRAPNEKAHRIVRFARTFSSPHCWVEPPLFVVGLSNQTCIC
ncbi:hypothetical protein ACS0TY_020204 [Phlomoides rotata]